MTDPAVLAAAIVTVIAAATTAVVTVVAAVAAAKERVLAAGQRKELLVATNSAAQQVSAHVAAKTAETDSKLEHIKVTTERAAEDVNGNLKSVREDLAKQTALSKALQETVTTLTGMLEESKKRAVRAGDVKKDEPRE